MTFDAFADVIEVPRPPVPPKVGSHGGTGAVPPEAVGAELSTDGSVLNKAFLRQKSASRQGFQSAVKISWLFAVCVSVKMTQRAPVSAATLGYYCLC